MRDLLPTVESWQADGRQCAVVRAVDVSGFGAGQYDNTLIMNDRGETAGSLLRGIATESIADAVASLFARPSDHPGSQVLQVEFDTAEAESVGLSCGGRARVLIQPIDALDPALWSAIERGETVALATWLDDELTTLLVREEPLNGSPTVTDEATPDRDVAAITLATQTLLQDQRSNRLSVDDNGTAVMIDKIVPRTRILAVGVGEVIEALVDQGRTLGWIVDAMPEGAGATDAAGALGSADALVITTHHPEEGPQLLAAALSSDSFFVGALGSRHTQQARADRLRELGLGDDDLARVHGPVGLDLGGRTPAETALAICAEIVAVRSGRALPSLRDRNGWINS